MELTNDQMMMIAGWTCFGVSEILSWSGCDANGLADVLIALGKIIKKKATPGEIEITQNQNQLPNV